MKPIPVKETHRKAIEDALKKVNGNSTAHTYTTFEEIESLAQNADRALSTLMYKKDMLGVCCRSTSGKRVPNSYQNSRIATEVILKKTSTGWSLIEVQREYLYNDPGKTKLEINPSHEEAVIDYLRRNLYDLVAEKVAGAPTKTQSLSVAA